MGCRVIHIEKDPKLPTLNIDKDRVMKYLERKSRYIGAIRRGMDPDKASALYGIKVADVSIE